MTKTKIIIGAMVVAAAAVGAYFYFPSNSSDAEVTWTTSEVTSQSITQSVTATGTIEPVTQVDVGTQVSGILTTLYVDYNSVVTKGQIIAELDKSTLLLDRNSNRNNVASAQSKFNYEESNYKRVKALFEKKLVADSEYEEALYSYESAKNALAVAENNLQRSATDLGYATIYSPIDGVVLSKSVEEGQTVASSFSTPTLFTIAADLRDMRVIVDVDEADIGGVKEGLRASFSVDAFPSDIFEGVVTQVRQEATVENNVVTYEVVISAANPDLKLKPGLTANVEIFTLDVKCKMVVPVAALSFTPPGAPGSEDGAQGVAPAQEPKQGGRPEGVGGRPEGMGGPMGGGGRPDGGSANRPKRVDPTSSEGEAVIWILRSDNRIEHRRVEVGVTNGILTQIVSGVEDGVEVVTGMEAKATASKSSPSTTTNPFVQKRPGQK